MNTRWRSFEIEHRARISGGVAFGVGAVVLLWRVPRGLTGPVVLTLGVVMAMIAGSLFFTAWWIDRGPAGLQRRRERAQASEAACRMAIADLAAVTFAAARKVDPDEIEVWLAEVSLPAGILPESAVGRLWASARASLGARVAAVAEREHVPPRVVEARARANARRVAMERTNFTMRPGRLIKTRPPVPSQPEPTHLLYVGAGPKPDLAGSTTLSFEAAPHPGAAVMHVPRMKLLSEATRWTPHAQASTLDAGVLALFGTEDDVATLQRAEEEVHAGMSAARDGTVTESPVVGAFVAEGTMRRGDLDAVRAGLDTMDVAHGAHPPPERKG